jgi:site-specific DNA-cytosine methylase
MSTKTEHRKQKQREYNAKYRQANRAKLRAADAKYREQNKEKRKRSQELHRNKDKASNPEKWRERWRRAKPRERTKERAKWEKEYQAARYNLPQQRLSVTLRARMRSAIKTGQKSGSAVRDLGCSTKDLVQHIESLWLPGMSWDNYGFYGWHIDHIKPLASFDLSDRNQFLEAAHYSNLQPLWAVDNLKKGKGTQ